MLDLQEPTGDHALDVLVEVVLLGGGALATCGTSSSFRRVNISATASAGGAVFAVLSGTGAASSGDSFTSFTLSESLTESLTPSDLALHADSFNSFTSITLFWVGVPSEGVKELMEVKESAWSPWSAGCCFPSLPQTR